MDDFSKFMEIPTGLDEEEIVGGEPYNDPQNIIDKRDYNTNKIEEKNFYPEKLTFGVVMNDNPEINYLKAWNQNELEFILGETGVSGFEVEDAFKESDQESYVLTLDEVNIDCDANLINEVKESNCELIFGDTAVKNDVIIGKVYAVISPTKNIYKLLFVCIMVKDKQYWKPIY